MSLKQERKIINQHVLYSGLGGPGAVFFTLAETDKSDRNKYVATFCGIEPLRDEYRTLCNKLNISYEYIEKKRGLHLGVYRDVYKSLKRNKPSVVFLHGVSFILPAFFYRLFHYGVSIVVRDTQAHHLKSKLEWVWLFICAVTAQRMVVLTEEAGSIIRKKFGFFCRKKIVVIPNGMNTQMFRPLLKSENSAVIRIGMQSRLQPIKDHITLLSAFKKVTEGIPEKKVVLEIAGDGVTKTDIEKKIEELKLQDMVILHGMLDTEQLLPFMQSLDIYVHSTFGETLSNSIMQAMACGLPIVATNVWGVNNMIKHESNGLLFESKNKDQLAAQLITLIKDPEMCNKLGRRARIFAEEHYSNFSMFNRYKVLFEDLE